MGILGASCGQEVNDAEKVKEGCREDREESWKEGGEKDVKETAR
jgi:hypothetical protein